MEQQKGITRRDGKGIEEEEGGGEIKVKANKC